MSRLFQRLWGSSHSDPAADPSASAVIDLSIDTMTPKEAARYLRRIANRNRTSENGKQYMEASQKLAEAIANDRKRGNNERIQRN